MVAASLADLAIDLLLPTLVYVLARPTHLAVAIRLTLGGFVMAAKATTGESISDTDQGRPANRQTRLLWPRRRGRGMPVTVTDVGRWRGHHRIDRGRHGGHRGLKRAAARADHRHLAASRSSCWPNP